MPLRDARRAARTLYFLHIPKCGGTAVTRAIDATMPADAILPGGLVADVLDLPAAELARHAFVRGHFGLLPPLRMGWQALHTVTLMREPLEQVLSLYAHVRENPAHYLHEDALAAGFGDFIRDPRWTALAGNLQARWLAVPPTRENTSWDVPVPAGYPYRVQAAFDLWPHGLDDAELEARARDTLAHIDVVGVAEDSAGALERVARLTGLRPRPLERANVSRRRLRADELEAADRAHLEGLVAVDRRLYAHAVRLDRGPDRARLRDRLIGRRRARR